MYILVQLTTLRIEEPITPGDSVTSGHAPYQTKEAIFPGDSQLHPLW